MNMRVNRVGNRNIGGASRSRSRSRTQGSLKVHLPPAVFQSRHIGESHSRSSRRRSLLVASRCTSGGSGGGSSDASSSSSSSDPKRDNEDGDDDDVQLTEMRVGAVTVTPKGFHILLVTKDASIPEAPNPVQVMRGLETQTDDDDDDDGGRCLPVLLTLEDKDAVSSRRGLSIMQLLQAPPIDLGIELKYELLDEITDNPGSTVGAVLIGAATDTEFSATILAGKDFDQSAYDREGDHDAAFEAMALALRYAPYGARIFATAKSLSESSIAVRDMRKVFPTLQTTAEARAIDAAATARIRLSMEQQKDSLSDDGDDAPPASQRWKKQ